MSLAIKASRARAGNISSGIAGRAVRLAASNAGQFPLPPSRTGFQGDPGLFGFLGKAAGFLGGALTGGLTGIAGSIAGAIAQQTNPPAGPGAVSFPSTPGIFGNPFQSQEGGVTVFDRLRVAGTALVPGGVEPFGNGFGCAVGFHPNKSSYFLKDGTFIQKGTVCVKNRRRNPLNPRAASRAIGRIEAAKKATRSLDRISVKCRRHGTSRCKVC